MTKKRKEKKRKRKRVHPRGAPAGCTLHLRDAPAGTPHRCHLREHPVGATRGCHPWVCALLVFRLHGFGSDFHGMDTPDLGVSITEFSSDLIRAATPRYIKRGQSFGEGRISWQLLSEFRKGVPERVIFFFPI